MKKALLLFILLFLFIEVFILCACNDSLVETELDLSDLSIEAVDKTNIPEGKYVLDLGIEDLDDYISEYNVVTSLTVRNSKGNNVTVKNNSFNITAGEIYTCKIEVKKGVTTLKTKTITVTAVALDIIKIKLLVPTNIIIDEDGNLSFDEVENATSYKIIIGDIEYSSDTNAKALGEIFIYNGTYQIKVRAEGDGSLYQSSVWTTPQDYVYTKGKIKLSSPTSLSVSDLKILSFTGTEDAVNYLIDINGTEVLSDNQEIDLSEYLSEPGTYLIKILAKGNGLKIEDSAWSNSIEKVITYNATPVENFIFIIDDGKATLNGFSESALSHIEDFSSIVIPFSYEAFPVTAIGASAFLSCDVLQSVTFPSSLNIIGDCAFMSCANLSSVVWGTGLDFIGTDAFRYCSALRNIKIPDSVSSIGAYSFFNSGIETMELGRSLETIGENAFGETNNLVSFSVKPENTNFTSEGGVLYSYDKKNLIKYPINKVGSTYSAAAETEIIIKDAFAYNTKLTTINFGINLKEISEEAFFDCINLTSVTILALIPPTLGEKAFKYESGIEYLTIDNLNIYVTESVVDTYKSVWSGYSAIIFKIE